LNENGLKARIIEVIEIEDGAVVVFDIG